MTRGGGAKGGQGEGHRREPAELANIPADPIATGLPLPPPDLDEQLHDGWYVIVDDLLNRGRTPAALREVDLEMVRQLLEAVWIHRQATEILHLEGVMIYKKAPILDWEKEPTGEFETLDAKQHPAVKTSREASATYLRLSETLAITPMARVRAGLMMVATKSLAEELSTQMAKVLAVGGKAPELEAVKPKKKSTKKPAKKGANKAKKPPAKKAPAKRTTSKKAPATKTVKKPAKKADKK